MARVQSSGLVVRCLTVSIKVGVHWGAAMVDIEEIELRQRVQEANRVMKAYNWWHLV